MRGYTTPAGYDRIDYVNRMCAQLYNAALQGWRDTYKITSYWNNKGRFPTYYDQSQQFVLVRSDDPEGWGGVSPDMSHVRHITDDMEMCAIKRIDSTKKG